MDQNKRREKRLAALIFPSYWRRYANEESMKICITDSTLGTNLNIKISTTDDRYGADHAGHKVVRILIENQDYGYRGNCSDLVHIDEWRDFLLQLRNLVSKENSKVGFETEGVSLVVHSFEDKEYGISGEVNMGELCLVYEPIKFSQQKFSEILESFENA